MSRTTYRYRLVHESNSGERSLFKIYIPDGEDKRIRNKFTLTELDAFTTRLQNEDELYLAFKLISGKVLDDGKFWIEYKQNHRTKKIRVIYNEEKTLYEFANNNIGKYNIEFDRMLINYVVNFIYQMNSNPELFYYLKENHYLNDYTSLMFEKLCEARDGSNEDYKDFTFRKLCSAMSSYKVIRNIEDGTRYFEMQKNRMFSDEKNVKKR